MFKTMVAAAIAAATAFPASAQTTVPTPAPSPAMPSTPAPPPFGNSGAGFRSSQNRSPDLVPLDRLFAQSKYYVNAYQ
jgi:hypothetical protein